MTSTYGPTVKFHVLGNVEVTLNGARVPLGGPQQRLVLALLVAADGRPASTDQLIDNIWADEIPSTARKAIQGYIYQLRSELGDAISTESNGYSLATNGDIDSREFERPQRRPPLS